MDLAEIDLTAGSDSTEFPNSPANDDNSTKVHASLTNGTWQKFSSDAFEIATANCPDGWANSYSDAGVVLGTDRKRCRRAMFDESAIEDIMDQINEKLNFAPNENLQRNNRIDAFIEVLGCSRMEAEFYLESSRWNVETAVILWLENNPHPRTSFPTHFPDLIPGYEQTIAKSMSPKYKEIEVIIEDLPTMWMAKVDPYDGQIYFKHRTTGYRQSQVPPGFADLEETSSTSMASASVSSPTVSNQISFELHNSGFMIPLPDSNEYQKRTIVNQPAWMTDATEVIEVGETEEKEQLVDNQHNKGTEYNMTLEKEEVPPLISGSTSSNSFGGYYSMDSANASTTNATTVHRMVETMLCSSASTTTYPFHNNNNNNSSASYTDNPSALSFHDHMTSTKKLMEDSLGSMEQITTREYVYPFTTTATTQAFNTSLSSDQMREAAGDDLSHENHPARDPTHYISSSSSSCNNGDINSMHVTRSNNTNQMRNQAGKKSPSDTIMSNTDTSGTTSLSSFSSSTGGHSSSFSPSSSLGSSSSNSMPFAFPIPSSNNPLEGGYPPSTVNKEIGFRTSSPVPFNHVFGTDSEYWK